MYCLKSLLPPQKKQTLHVLDMNIYEHTVQEKTIENPDCPQVMNPCVLQLRQDSVCRVFHDGRIKCNN